MSRAAFQCAAGELNGVDLRRPVVGGNLNCGLCSVGEAETAALGGYDDSGTLKTARLTTAPRAPDQLWYHAPMPDRELISRRADL